MFENMLIAILTSFAFNITLFFIGLYIGRYLNSLSIYRIISLISSISTIFIYAILGLQSAWFTQRPLLVFVFSGYDVSLSLKFIELAFGFPWTYIQKMPFKLTLMYLLALPYMPESEDKLKELSKEYIRYEAYSSIMRGILQLILHRIILYFTPLEWLTLPLLSSSSFIVYYCRYFLLCFILYLSIDIPGNLGFSFYSLIFNIRMKPVFPGFPYIATSLRDFWSYRWNNMVKTQLHRMSFVVLPKILPVNDEMKGLFAFVLSGFIHEYTILFVSGSPSGKNILFFLLQGLLVLFELMIKLPSKPTTLDGKLKGWLWTVGTLMITSPLFFNPFIESGVFASMK